MDQMPGAAVLRALGIRFGPPSERPLTGRDTLGQPVDSQMLGGGNHIVTAPDLGPLILTTGDIERGVFADPEIVNMRRGGGLRDPRDPNS
jgi:hypothetical protein